MHTTSRIDGNRDDASSNKSIFQRNVLPGGAWASPEIEAMTVRSKGGAESTASSRNEVSVRSNIDASTLQERPARRWDHINEKPPGHTSHPHLCQYYDLNLSPLMLNALVNVALLAPAPGQHPRHYCQRLRWREWSFRQAACGGYSN